MSANTEPISNDARSLQFLPTSNIAVSDISIPYPPINDITPGRFFCLVMTVFLLFCEEFFGQSSFFYVIHKHPWMGNKLLLDVKFFIIKTHCYLSRWLLNRKSLQEELECNWISPVGIIQMLKCLFEYF